MEKSSGIKTIPFPCHDHNICDPKALDSIQETVTEDMFKNKGQISFFSNGTDHPFVYARKAVLEEGESFFTEVQKLNFDLVFVDSLFPFRWYYLIPHRMGVPYVSLSNVLDPIASRVPWLPSFVPHQLMAISDRMTFIERMQNVFANIMFQFATFIPPVSPDTLSKYKEYGDFSSLEELESRSLLFLQTSDEILDFPKPLMPNIINIGGLTVNPAKPLSKEHLEYAENSAQGLIVVSFGSGVKYLPSDIAKKMISAFSRLKENVIWRFYNTQNFVIPKNVRLSNWLPQNDYLAHKNVKLFLTHCGKHGVFESLYHGKPMVGMPLHLEQKYTAAVLRHHAYGHTLNMFDFTEDELFLLMRKVIDHPVYTENVQRASAIFKSRNAPAERATYWIEHVLKYGDNHLRSHAFNMPWYQFMMLDMLLAIVVLFVVVILMFALVLRQCFIISRSKISDQKKTN